MDTTDIRRAALSNKIKIGLVMLVGLIVSPFIFMAIQGLVGLIVAAVVTVSAVQLAPVFAMKMANWRMKLIVGEAKANPIETMKNLFVEKSTELQKADENIVAFEASIGDYYDEMQQFKKKYPDEAAQYENIGQKMKQGLIMMQHKQQLARIALGELKDQIAKAEAIYNMSLAVAKVTSFSKKAEDRVFQEIKEKVAFDSVRNRLNTSFAALNMELSKQEEYKTLPASTGGDTVPVSTTPRPLAEVSRRDA